MDFREAQLQKICCLQIPEKERRLLGSQCFGQFRKQPFLRFCSQFLLACLHIGKCLICNRKTKLSRLPCRTQSAYRILQKMRRHRADFFRTDGIHSMIGIQQDFAGKFPCDAVHGAVPPIQILFNGDCGIIFRCEAPIALPRFLFFSRKCNFGKFSIDFFKIYRKGFPHAFRIRKKHTELLFLDTGNHIVLILWWAAHKLIPHIAAYHKDTPAG